MKIKTIVLLILVTAIYILFKLPTKEEIISTNSHNQNKLAQIEDYDYNLLANKLWVDNKKENAISALNIVIDNDLPRKKSSIELLLKYKSLINQRNSATGKLKALGLSFSTGKTNSFDELKSSALGDFFLYGNINPLKQELSFDDNSDKLISSLNSFELVTDFIPLAKPAVNLLKTSKKTDILSEPIIAQLIKTFKPLKGDIENISGSQIKNMFQTIMPAWELVSKSQSWNQYALFMKQCKNINQIKFFVNILSKSGNAQKLEGLLVSSPNISKEILGYIKKYGQSGLNNLFGVIRKGEMGIKILIQNPSFNAKLSNNLTTNKSSWYGKLKNFWQPIAIEKGWIVELIRGMLIIASSLFLMMILFPKRLLNTFSNNNKDKAIHTFVYNYYYGIIAFALFVLCTVISFSRTTSIELKQNATNAIGEQLSAASDASGFSVISLILLLCFFAVQTYFFFKARTELEKIIAMDEPNEIKLKLLDSAEIYLDLPVYAGLTGTIIAFILMNIDPSGSRMVAYSSTMTGIIISAFLRVLLLHPCKQGILITDKKEVEQENIG